MTIHGGLVPCRLRAEDLVADGECLLYNPARDEASALNRTATEIWDLCDGRATIGTIATMLGERYGVDARLLIDEVIQTVVALQSRGLVECVDGPRVDGG